MIPAVPVPAASLILLREGDGLEVLVGRRSETTRAFPGAIVFPGGKLDRQDEAWPGVEAPSAAALYAALRETFEETGLFIAADGRGPPPGAEVGEARRAVEAGEQPFQALVEAWGRPLGVERPAPYAHWITPEGRPYRFDTLFFIVEASPFEAAAELLWAEFESLAWRGPAELLAQEGERLMAPTRGSLLPLLDARTPAEAVEAARRRGVIARPGAQPFAAR